MAKSTAIILLLLIPVISSLYIPGVQRRSHPSRDRSPNSLNKRPFCNAFTGCGRKRSQLPPLTGVQELGAAIDNDGPADENLGTLLDLSAEPAVEDLSRQIMSEAKLWEAIQEANIEIMRQKQAQAAEEQQQQQQPQRLVGNGGSPKCAFPSCIAQ